jgi:hypothetical protein
MPVGSFGPRLYVLTGFLRGQIEASQCKVQEILGTLFEVKVSVGSIAIGTGVGRLSRRMLELGGAETPEGYSNHAMTDSVGKLENVRKSGRAYDV